MTPPLVGLREIRQAAKRISGVAIRTPLLPSTALSEETGAEVRLKCESLQQAGSFKIRGAYNYVSHLSDEQRAPGIITYSSGNHAQAVALAAKLNGIRAVVVMPTDAPDVKRRGAERLGAEVVFEGTTSLERKARAETIAEAEGLHVVPPFDHPYIIAGQGTTGLEIMTDWPEADTVFVPIGGGGLVSGVAAAVRELKPDALIFGVEPRGAAAMKAALDAGHPVTLDGTDTIADGLKPVRSGDLTFEHVRALVDDVVVVEDPQIREAASLLLATSKLVVEFSGAATVAAVRSGVVPLAGRHVVAVLSGGNLDPLILEELARGESDTAV
ncbi:MAG: threonine dehydratase [Myxococcota bacterium]|jgi:threonine dehydratase